MGGETEPPRAKVTRGEQMLALRKKRMAETHPFLRGGFRPFFLGSALWALVAIAIWLGELAGFQTLQSAFGPVEWHRHEMLFGFVGAAMVGFLLTAIPNWTGRLPIAGMPLLCLFGLWVAARIAVFSSAHIGFLVAAMLDVGVYVTLATLATREVIATSNRNLPVVGIVFLFGVADAADYAGAAGRIPADLGWRGAIALIILMISLIGGRIIPSFTRNWMVKRTSPERLPTQPQPLDLLVITITALALLFWLALPDNRLTGWMLVTAAAAQTLRLSRWGWNHSFSHPLVAILHVGYAWVPAGLALLGLSVAGFDVPRSAGIHALTTGAMSTMILAVMTRATLGHTGRDLTASATTTAAYACVTVGALLRVLASMGVGPYPTMLDISGAVWGAGLLLFVIGYAPMLWRPRVGEQR